MSAGPATVLGLEVAPLDEGWRPLNVIAVVASVDLSDPDMGPAARRLSTRSNDDLDLWTAIGMLRSALVDLEAQYVGLVRGDPE